MDKNFKQRFDQCPNCGSDQRFLEQLGQELKDRNLARETWNQHYEVKKGIVVDKDRAVAMPIGVSLPGYIIATDICMDCGTLYAVQIVRIEGRTQAMPINKDNLPPGLLGNS